MAKTTHLHPSDLRGLARLATSATGGVADVVEAMHHTISRPLAGSEAKARGRTGGLTGVVYEAVRGVTQLVGGGIDALLAQLQPTIAGSRSSPAREHIISALNGAIGDHLVATGNPLAIPMTLRRGGISVVLERSALESAFPEPGGKLVIMVHGLCMSDLRWNRNGHDHGAELAKALGHTPLYLNYNSGEHVSKNGHAFAEQLDMLVREWPRPVDELTIIAHSMGGLVARSACHYGDEAGHEWRRHLRRIVFLGTPHQGAPLERGGNMIDMVLGAVPYSAPIARVGKVRSAGITDLRYGNLLDEDWEGRDRFAGGRRSHRQLVPLPAGVRCYAIAATTGKAKGDVRDRVLGDGLVPLDSALGKSHDPLYTLAFPKSRQWIAHEMNHMDLLDRPEVTDRIQRWMKDVSPQ